MASGPRRQRDHRSLPAGGLSEEIILSEIGTSTTNFNTGTQDLIQWKEGGVNDNIINVMVQKSGRR